MKRRTIFIISTVLIVAMAGWSCRGRGNRADNSAASHTHTEGHAHDNGHDHNHEHGSECTHDHGHGGEHGHTHGEAHAHHEHGAECTHEHGDSHGHTAADGHHQHGPDCDHGHETASAHEHGAECNHGHEHGHGAAATHGHHEHGPDCDHGHETASAHEHGADCDHGHDHGDGGHAHADGEIVFTSEQAREAGLEVTAVKPSTFRHVIRTSGEIASARGDRKTVTAAISGIVSFEKASLNAGAKVSSGETLLSISAAQLGDGDPVARAETAYEIARQEYERAGALVADRLISQSEYNAIKLDYEDARVTWEALGRNRSGGGMGVKSPAAGFVNDIFVAEGQYVEAGQPLLTVSRNRGLQLVAEVSERYYKDLDDIVSANFRTPYDRTVYSLSELDGRLVSYGRAVPEGDYFIPVTFEFDNPGGVVPGSYVEVFLLSRPREGVISVPVGALIEEQGIFSVYVQLDAEHYKKREVRTGQNDGGRVEILSGLRPGERIVSKGAYHVRVASASAAIPHGHEH